MSPTRPVRPTRPTRQALTPRPFAGDTRRRFAAAAVALAAACAAGSAGAEITFSFEYGIDDGLGFWDPVHGTVRRAALDTAASQFSTTFAGHFANSASIVILATASDDPFGGSLASAGSQLIGAATGGFTLIEVMRHKALFGTDANGSNHDGNVDVNFGQPWHLDASTPTPADRFDFYGTMAHEMIHALGFASTIDEAGQPLIPGQWAPFDSWLTDAAGNRLIDPVDFTIDQRRWGDVSIGGSGFGVFFDGPNARAANGGNPVGLYSPTTWEEGSSISHVDTDDPALQSLLMAHAVDFGPAARDLGPIEVGMMLDLGYTAALPIPEPTPQALLLAGLAVLAWTARRRLG